MAYRVLTGALAGLLLVAAGAMGQTTPAALTAPVVIDLKAATADIKARAAWCHAELARIADIVAKKPPTSRPMMRTRTGALAPDPRPTPEKAVAEARKLDAKVDNAALAAIQALPSTGDKAAFDRQLMFSRLYINEAIELVLIALKDTDEKSVLPAWLGVAEQMPAAAAHQLDIELSTTVYTQWSAVNPDAVGGIGKVGVGAGGKETVQTYVQGQMIEGLAEVASPRVSFRVNPAQGQEKKQVVSATTPNFTLILKRQLDLPGLPLREKTLLEKRFSAWWYRNPVADISAAASVSASAPSTATKPK